MTNATTAPTPTGLTLHAGAFYRTRDGRKVEIIEQRQGYMVGDNGRHYALDGTCVYEGLKRGAAC